MLVVLLKNILKKLKYKDRSGKMSLLKRYDESMKNYGETVLLKKEEVLKIEFDEFTEIWSGGDLDYRNFYYFLYANLVNQQKLNNYKEAAYLAYLLSFLFFMISTPPASEYLADYFIKLAQSLDEDNKLYKEFQKTVDEGN